MRVIVFFDLPVETASQRKTYRQFRTLLIKNGFMMMQESVYCKIVLNGTAAKLLSGHIKDHKPKQGLVQILTVTERQFSKIETITGEVEMDFINTDERLIIL